MNKRVLLEVSRRCLRPHNLAWTDVPLLQPISALRRDQAVWLRQIRWTRRLTRALPYQGRHGRPVPQLGADVHPATVSFPDIRYQDVMEVRQRDDHDDVRFCLEREGDGVVWLDYGQKALGVNEIAKSRSHQMHHSREELINL